MTTRSAYISFPPSVRRRSLSILVAAWTAVLLAACGGGSGGGGGGSDSDSEPSGVVQLDGTDGVISAVSTFGTETDVVFAEIDSDRTDGRYSLLTTEPTNSQTVIVNVVRDDGGNIIDIEQLMFVDQATGGTLTIEYGDDLLPVRFIESVGGDTWTWTFVEQTGDDQFLFSLEQPDGSRSEVTLTIDPDAFGYFRAIEDESLLSGAVIRNLDRNTEENLRQSVDVLLYGAGVTVAIIGCAAATAGTAGVAAIVCGGAIASTFAGGCALGGIKNEACEVFNFVDSVNKCTVPVNCAIGIAELLVQKQPAGAAECAFNLGSELVGSVFGSETSSRVEAFSFSTSDPTPQCTPTTKATTSEFDYAGGVSLQALGW